GRRAAQPRVAPPRRLAKAHGLSRFHRPLCDLVVDLARVGDAADGSRQARLGLDWRARHRVWRCRDRSSIRPMIRTAACAAVVCAFAFGSAAFAADPERAPQGLDALGAIRYALGHAPAILAKRSDFAGLVASFTQKRSAQYPSVDGQLQNQIARSSNLGGQF